MKKLVTMLMFLIILTALPKLHAEETTSPGWFEWKGVTVLVPFADVSGVFLYDFIGKENLLGAETPIVLIKKAKDLTLTFGAVTDASTSDDNSGEGELRERERLIMESGTLFFGLHIPMNLRENIELGGFLGRNLAEGKNMAGLKCSVKFW